MLTYLLTLLKLAPAPAPTPVCPRRLMLSTLRGVERSNYYRCMGR